MSEKWQVLVRPNPRIEPDPGTQVDILGVYYNIKFRELEIGASFVIPTVASASQVAEALAPATSFYNLELVCEEITWFDMAAVRVHRVSSRVSTLPSLARRY